MLVLMFVWVVLGDNESEIQKLLKEVPKPS